jgi:hypothetical protein
VKDDRLLWENPCRMRRLDKEPTSERPTASVDQVWRLAALMPPQFPALVIFAAFTGLRWGDLVALRVRVLILTPQWCTSCESSLNCGTANGFRTGRSQIPGSHSGLALSAGGSGTRALAEFPRSDPEDLIFKGPKGAAFRRNNFHRSAC